MTKHILLFRYLNKHYFITLGS